VVALPTGPSQVGRFLGYIEEGGGVVDLDKTDVAGTTFLGFSIPADWKGRLTLKLGSAAKPGVPYTGPTFAYAEGEPLACTDTFGKPLSEAVPDLEGYAVRVFSGGKELTLPAALDQGLGSQPITNAQATSASTLLIDVGGAPNPDAEAAVAPC
jgi:hypothetical protein